MESLVMVAYIVSITAGLPLAEVTTNADGDQREQVERSLHLNSTGKGKSYSTDANATAVRSRVTTTTDDILRTGDSNLMTSYVKTYGDATSMTSDQELESKLRDDDVTSASVVRTESAAAASSDRRTMEGDPLQGPSSLRDSSLPLTSAQTESESPRDSTDDLQTSAELEQQQQSTTTTTTTTTTTERTANETDDAREVNEVAFWTVVENSSPAKEESGSGEGDLQSEAERRRSFPSTESQEKETEKEKEKEKEETGSRDVPAAFVTTAIDEATFQRYSAIVEALEELGILSSDGEWCYSVYRITRSTQMSSSSSSLLWRVELLIAAIPMSSSASPLPPDETSTQLQRLERTGSDVQPTSGVECLVDSTSGETSAGGVDCIQVPVNATDEETSVNNGSDSIPEKKKLSSAQLYDNGAMKPSKTQIFVISTCSVVIGLFFVVALIMRIRNHLKRTRTLNKHRGGVRHHRPTSGPRDHPPSAAASLPLATAPPVDADQKQNDADEKKRKSSSSVGRFFDRRWRSSGEKKEGEAKDPMAKRRQGELKRFFISQRSQREAAREYIRQLSLTNPAHPPPPPPPAGEQPPSAVETSPSISSKKLVSQPSRSFQKLNIS